MALSMPDQRKITMVLDKHRKNNQRLPLDKEQGSCYRCNQAIAAKMTRHVPEIHHRGQLPNAKLWPVLIIINLLLSSVTDKALPKANSSIYLGDTQGIAQRQFPVKVSHFLMYLFR